MPVDLDCLRGSYFLRGHDPDFATGRRSRLVYALPSWRVSYTHLNHGGPEPLAYLEYARRDIADGTQQGAINALGHAKRAAHLVIDKLLEAYSLNEWLKAPFPVQAELLRDISAFPTRMLTQLNRARNLMEHKYSFVEVGRAADFVEIVDLFLTVAYPFFRGGAIGASVGMEGDTQCTEWSIEPRTRALAIFDVAVESFLELPVGRVHYNIERPRDARPRLEVPLLRSRQTEWMPHLDLLVYCTRRETLRLPETDERGSGVHYHRSVLMFPSDAGDGNE